MEGVSIYFIDYILGGVFVSDITAILYFLSGNKLSVWDFSSYEIPFLELYYSILISILLGILLLFLDNNNVCFKILLFLSLSDKESNSGTFKSFLRNFYRDVYKINKNEYGDKNYQFTILVKDVVYSGVISGFYENYQTNEVEFCLNSGWFYEGGEKYFFESILVCCKKSELKIIYEGECVNGW